MSSMTRMTFLHLALAPILAAVAVPAPAAAQNVSWDARWDQQRAQLLASQPGPMAAAVTRWEALTASENLNFDDYAGFLLTYPDFPRAALIRERAEARLAKEPVSAQRITGFFDRFPPQTPAGLSAYAVALTTMGDRRAAEWATKAWRAGPMDASAEAVLASRFGMTFSPADQDARMNALLWAGDLEAAQRQLARVSPASAPVFAARLSARNGTEPGASAMSDPGFVYDRVRQLRAANRVGEAVSLLANRPTLAEPVLDREAWVTQLLRVARSADGRNAVRIASKIDDAFPQGFDVSTGSYRLRDDYTSLMWLGGTEALWKLGDAASAAPLFYRYGAAAQTPQTRSKGFYWAGHAASRAGDASAAERYYRMAGEYRGQFYGLLALDALGIDHTQAWQSEGVVVPSQDLRAEFYANPLVAATTEAARGRDWRTARYFFTHMADTAETPEELALVAELAQRLGRRDFAVVIGEAAAQKGFAAIQSAGYPVLPSTPTTGNWTMIHAISRQESEFDTTRVSHAGAAGLMQLMPGTAREQAGKLSASYRPSDLTRDAGYNVMLGDAYFRRMLDYYGGAYPLAIAAYNAGPGNVNKWLRANGDPRTGAIDYPRWIEEIPFFETKNYVQRVVENAVTYQVLNPDKAGYGGPKDVGWFLRR